MPLLLPLVMLLLLLSFLWMASTWLLPPFLSVCVSAYCAASLLVSWWLPRPGCYPQPPPLLLVMLLLVMPLVPLTLPQLLV